MTSSWVQWREINFNILLQKLIGFLYRLILTSFICTGGHCKKKISKKGTHECLEMPCENFCLKKNEIKDYCTHVLKNDTSSVDMNEKGDHLLDSFEKFHKKNIIIPSLLLNPLLKRISLSLFNHHQVSLIKKMRKYVI